MDYGCLISPAAARGLPEGSRERALARLGLRQWWHIVLDPCPALVKSFPPDGLAILDPFLQYAFERKLSMGWSLHGHLLLWLEDNHFASFSEDAATELLAAAAARWTNTDQSEDKAILLHFHARPGTGIAGWKSRAAAEENRVVLVDLPGARLEGRGISMAACTDAQYPEDFLWSKLPQ